MKLTRRENAMLVVFSYLLLFVAMLMHVVSAQESPVTLPTGNYNPPVEVPPDVYAAYFDLDDDMLRAILDIPQDVQITDIERTRELQLNSKRVTRVFLAGKALPRVGVGGKLPKIKPPVYIDSTGTVRTWGWRAGE